MSKAGASMKYIGSLLPTAGVLMKSFLLLELNAEKWLNWSKMK